MCLSLLYMSDKYKMSYVLHEFGHALGLDHEHQRSDFWDILGQKDGPGEDDYRFIIGEAQMTLTNVMVIIDKHDDSY